MNNIKTYESWLSDKIINYKQKKEIHRMCRKYMKDYTISNIDGSIHIKKNRSI